MQYLRENSERPRQQLQRPVAVGRPGKHGQLRHEAVLRLLGHQPRGDDVVRVAIQRAAELVVEEAQHRPQAAAQPPWGRTEGVKGSSATAEDGQKVLRAVLQLLRLPVEGQKGLSTILQLLRPSMEGQRRLRAVLKLLRLPERRRRVEGWRRFASSGGIQ